MRTMVEGCMTRKCKLGLLGEDRVHCHERKTGLAVAGPLPISIPTPIASRI